MTLAVIALAALVGLQEPAPQPAPKKGLRIQGQIKEPKKLKNVTPKYPEEALRAGLRGMVILECGIDTQGRVNDVRVLKGVPPLIDAATKAVKQWRYTATQLDGVPVPVIMTVTVNFNRELRFHVEDLLDSLKSSNEFIRESAVTWLGTARLSRGVEGTDILRIREEITRLAGSDPSDRVQAACARALRQLNEPR